MISEHSVIHVPTSAVRVRPFLFERALRFCVAIGNSSVRVCQRALAAAWTTYVDAHVFTLHNGITVWIDECQTFVIDTPETLDGGSIGEYDQWLQAQVLAW